MEMPQAWKNWLGDGSQLVYKLDDYKQFPKIVVGTAEDDVENVPGVLGKVLDSLLDRLLQQVTTGRVSLIGLMASGVLQQAPSLMLRKSGLTIVDGGEDSKNVPLTQLLVKPRALDVVVAIDTTSDTTLSQRNNYPKPLPYQAFESTTSGFVKNSLGADPNFPKCLQCTAIDRTRLLSARTIPRSDVCKSCFNPTSNQDFPRRTFVFVDLDPTALAKAESFIKEHKLQFSIRIGTGVGSDSPPSETQHQIHLDFLMIMRYDRRLNQVIAISKRANEYWAPM
ncbi:hypothetical protein M422DRAFT_243838 [Sphaerobolus stellatus SS14]|nr:hypothetical protein M422DRAFT_243838 [Sphaerobolus stellatus SS14]